MQTDGFNFHDRAVQNHMVGNINTRVLANQLRPVAAELARRGEQPYALVTMTQYLNHRMASSQPQQLYYPPTSFAFNAQAALRHKVF